MMDTTEGKVDGSSGGGGGGAEAAAAPQVGVAAPDIDEAAFAAALEMLASDNDAVLVEGLVYFRKLLCRKERPPIKRVRETGMIPHVAALLKDVGNSVHLRYEAAWLLTNVAAGDASDTQEVVENGMVQAALEYITGMPLVAPAEVDEDGDINMEEEGTGELCAQCAWLLANVAGEVEGDTRNRDMVLQAGAVPAIVRLLQAWTPGKGAAAAPVPVWWLHTATWAATNLVRGKPLPDPAAVRGLLPMFARLVTVTTDRDVVKEAARGLVYIAKLRGMPAELRGASTTLDGDEVPLMKAVVVSMRRQEAVTLILGPLLQCLGAMIADGDPASVMDSGAVPALLGLLGNSEKKMRKESWRVLSNMAAGTPEQVEKLLESGIARPALDALECEDADVRKYVLATVANALLKPGKAVQHFALQLLTGGLHTKLGKYTDPACRDKAAAAATNLARAMGEWASELEGVRGVLAALPKALAPAAPVPAPPTL